LTACFAPMSRAEVDRRFGDIDACVTAVNTFEDFATSEFARSRGLIRQVPGFPMPVLAPPFIVDGERPQETTGAPVQGEHTLAVLREAGVNEERIAALLASGGALARER
jgi:alpha-methylacyl-CoA racemase